MEVKHLQFYGCFLGVTETNTYVKSGWKSQQVWKRDREIDPRRAAKALTKEDGEVNVILYREHHRSQECRPKNISLPRFLFTATFRDALLLNIDNRKGILKP